MCALICAGFLAATGWSNAAGAQENDTVARANSVISQAGSRRSEKPLQYWAEQLSHDRYLRRQAAQRQLVAGGKESVAVLEKILSGADMETTHSAISILAKIASTESPNQTDGAFAGLQRVADTGFGVKSTIAKSTLRSFAEVRGAEARLRLIKSGIFIGTETLALGSRSQPRLVVRIDHDWNGDPDSLGWFRWLHGLEFVVLVGDVASEEVLHAIAQMPHVKTLVFIDTPLTPQALTELRVRKRIEGIEFRYVPLDETMLAGLGKLRLRGSLYLMGTGVTPERVDQLRMEMPGLDILHRQGGFLGVICTNTLADYCEVDQVMAGSGAAESGLQSGDVIIRIGDARISRFEDLQRQINNQLPGDEIKIRFRRNEQLFDTTAILGKLTH